MSVVKAGKGLILKFLLGIVLNNGLLMSAGISLDTELVSRYIDPVPI